MKNVTKLGIGIGAAALVALLFTEGVLFPKQLQPNVLPVVFKQYHNGSNLTASFEMRNESGTPVVVWETATLVAQKQPSPETREITIPRTVIPEGETRVLVVDAPEDCSWQVQFRVARFGPRQQRRYEAGESLKGTIVFSEVVPAHNSAP